MANPLSGFGFHSYASRIGSKNKKVEDLNKELVPLFPFIRFTNWKQASVVPVKTNVLGDNVSIHTLHELEARRSVLSAGGDS